MIRILLYSVYALSFCHFQVQAQSTEKLDSLKNLLKEASRDDSISLLYGIGHVYFGQEDYIASIDYYFSSMKLAEESQKSQIAADAANSIGSVYYNTNNFKNALLYYQKALQYFKAEGDEKKSGSVYNNLALVYYEIDSIDKAIDYYQQALTIKKKYNERLEVGAIYHNLGLVYMYTKDYSASLKNLKEARDIFISLDNKHNAANATNNIGRMYFKQGDYDKALEYFEKALIEANEVKSAFLIMDNYKYQADCYARMNRHMEAYWYTNEFYTLKDSLLNINKEKELAEIQARYENEIREQENDLLKKENEAKAATIRLQYLAGLGIAVISLLLGILAVIYYRGNRIKKRANELLSTQQAEILQKNKTLSILNEEIKHQYQEIGSQKTELEDLNGIKDKLFSIISHEFRSPLNSLKGTLALLKVGALNEQELNIISTELTDKINSTSIFLDNLLNWAKSQMQGINPRASTLDLKDTVDENVEFLRSLADKKKVHLDNLVTTPLFAFADPNMLHLVIRNLLSNAIKFSMRGGQIKVSGTRNGDFIIISVQDNGIGMSKENVKLLFQIHTFTTRGTANERGTGLGLFISKTFIEANGGKIWVESEEGVGSTFHFTVPAAKTNELF